MYCQKCGKNIDVNATFCPFCGAEQNTTGHNGTTAESNAGAFAGTETGQVYVGAQNAVKHRSQLSNRNKLLIVIAGVVVIAVIVIIIVTSNSRPSINLNNYLTVSDYGYDGYGSLDYDIDYAHLMADYGGKLKLTSEGNSNYVMGSAAARGEDPVDLIYDDISIHPDVSRDLSNGDKVTFTWDTLKINMLETYIKVSIKTKDYVYTVSDLEEPESEDFFNYVSVDFSGISSEGTAEVSVDCEWLSPYDFLLNKSEGLSNGDTVTVSINDYSLESILSESGKAPIETEKKYTVEGLIEYITSLDEIPSDDFEKMQSTATDYIESAFNVDEWGAKVNGKEYLGSYLIGHDVYLIYRIDLTITYNGETENVDNYWYCCFQNCAINAGGEFGTINENGDFTTGDIDYSSPSYTSDVLTGSPIGEGFRIKVGGQGINIAGFQTLQELKDQISADSALDSSVSDSPAEA